MLQTFHLLAFFNLVVLFVRGTPTVSLFKNVNGTEEIAPSFLVVTNGNNFTLTCETRDVEAESQNHLDNQIVWKRKTNDVRFQNKNGMESAGEKPSVINNMELPELKFTPVKLHDQGIYSCTNVKYSLSKSLLLLVRPSTRGKELLSKSRSRRAQFNPWNTHQWGGDKLTEMPRIDLPDPVKDFLDGPKKKDNRLVGKEMYDQLFKNSHMSFQNPHTSLQYPQFSSSYDPYSYNNPNSNDVERQLREFNLRQQLREFNLRQSEEMERKSREFEEVLKRKTGEHEKNPKNRHGFFYAIVIILIIMVVGLLIACACQKPPNSNSQRDPAVNSTCAHTVCARNRRSNPSFSCMMESLNSSRQPPLPELIHRNVDVGTNTLTSLITPVDTTRDNTQADHLDAPPSYINSVRNSVYSTDDSPNALVMNGCDMPPSYDEAVASLPPSAPRSSAVNSLSAPRDVAVNSSVSEPPDVARVALWNAPLASRDDL